MLSEILGACMYPFADSAIRAKPPGVGALDFHLDGGCRWGVENMTLSQTARPTKKNTLSQYTLLKLSYAYPVLVRTDSLFSCVSSYIHKNLLRPARAVAGAEIAGL